MKEKKIKVFIVDVYNQKKCRVEVIQDNLEEFYKIINCNMVEYVSRKIGDKYYRFIIDEAGGCKKGIIASIYENKYKILLVGNIIICNYDEKENNNSLTMKDIKNIKKYIYGATVFNENGSRERIEVLSGVTL